VLNNHDFDTLIELAVGRRSIIQRACLPFKYSDKGTTLNCSTALVNSMTGRGYAVNHISPGHLTTASAGYGNDGMVKLRKG